MIGGPLNDYANGVKLLPDGRCIIIGSTDTSVNGTETALLMLDAMGQQIIWDYTVGGMGEDIGYDLVLSNTSFWWIGVTTSEGQDICIGHHTMLGEPLVIYTIGGPGNEVGKSIDIAPNGKVTIGAEIGSFGSGGKDMYVATLDVAGILNKSKVVGGREDEHVGAVIFTPDEESIAIGDSNSYSSYQSLLFVKVRYDNIDCGSLVTPTQRVVTGPPLMEKCFFFTVAF